jgi:hypothetical protein
VQLAVEHPLGGEGVHHLADLDPVERLAQDEQAVRGRQLGHDLRPAVIGEGRADDDLDIGVHAPDVRDGLDAVPAGRHAHVDEGHRVGAARGLGRLHQLEAFLSLVRGIDLELHPARVGGRLVEEVGLESRELGAATGAAEVKDLLHVLVDRLVVIDDEDAGIHQDIGGTLGAAGRSVSSRIGSVGHVLRIGAPTTPLERTQRSQGALLSHRFPP